MGKTAEKKYFRLVLREFLQIGVMVAVLFLIAGRLSYWQGWLYAALSFWLPVATLLGSLWNPRLADLLRERMKPAKPGQAGDKALVAVLALAFLSGLVVGALDGGRFHWTGPLPAWAYVLGSLASVLSAALVLWAMVVNRFFSSVVRIQSDRGQVVCRKGPYRIVRHPGYAGMILGSAGTPLVLGSLWALVPSLLMAAVLVVRTVREEGVLKSRLSGYSRYASQVRYRLMPGIW